MRQINIEAKQNMVIEYEVKPYGLITKISLKEPTSN